MSLTTVNFVGAEPARGGVRNPAPPLSHRGNPLLGAARNPNDDEHASSPPSEGRRRGAASPARRHSW